jgi:hypothetical protein
MSRGMETLLHKRHLLNPFRYGGFAWKLFSHKVCRWLTPCVGAFALLALAVLEIGLGAWPWVLGAIAAVSAVSTLAWYWPADRRMPRPISLLASAVFVNVATMHAAIKAASGDENAAWEPTRRDTAFPAETSRA